MLHAAIERQVTPLEQIQINTRELIWLDISSAVKRWDRRHWSASKKAFAELRTTLFVHRPFAILPKDNTRIARRLFQV